MKVSHIAVVAALLGTSFVARADDAPAQPAAQGKMMEMPKPSPEMEKLKMFMAKGDWKCKGQAGMPGMAMHPVQAKVPMKEDLNGMMFMSRYEESKTKENPMPFQAVSYISYDTASKMFMRTMMDSMGNMMSMTAPASMDGDKMTFQGDAMMNGNKMPMRMTMEKKGKEMMMSMEASSSDGNWTKTMDLTCKK